MEENAGVVEETPFTQEELVEIKEFETLLTQYAAFNRRVRAQEEARKRFGPKRGPKEQKLHEKAVTKRKKRKHGGHK
jgi:hypothetical protein